MQKALMDYQWNPDLFEPKMRDMVGSGHVLGRARWARRHLSALRKPVIPTELEPASRNAETDVDPRRKVLLHHLVARQQRCRVQR